MLVGSLLEYFCLLKLAVVNLLLETCVDGFWLETETVVFGVRSRTKTPVPIIIAASNKYICFFILIVVYRTNSLVKSG